MCSTTYRKRLVSAPTDYPCTRQVNVRDWFARLAPGIGFVILVATIATFSAGEEPEQDGEKFRSDAEREALCHFESKGRAVRNGRLVLYYRNDDEFTAEDWRQLSHLKCVTSLQLIGKKFNDDHLKHLEDLCSLRYLNLTTTSVTGEGLTHLNNLPNFAALASNRPLTHLPELKNLKWLSLSGSTVTDDYVVEVVAELDDLEHLRLPRTRITDNALKHVAKLGNLKRLHLGGTRITDEGLVHLKDLQNLESLNLRNTRISDDAIVKHLREMKSLRRLDHPAGLPDRGRTEKIREDLPNVRIPYAIPP